MPCTIFGAPPQTTVDLDDASQIRQMGSGGAVLPMPVRDAVGALVRTPADPLLSPDMSEATLAPLRDELRASGQVGPEHDLRAFYMRVAPGLGSSAEQRSASRAGTSCEFATRAGDDTSAKVCGYVDSRS